MDKMTIYFIYKLFFQEWSSRVGSLTKRGGCVFEDSEVKNDDYDDRL